MTYRRKETIGDATLYLGDCLEILPTLPKVDAVVTDPPYGVGLKKKTSRYSVSASSDAYDDDASKVMPIVKSAVVLCIELARSVVITPGVRNLHQYPPSASIGTIYSPGAGGRDSWGFGCNNPILFYGKCPYLATGKGSRPNSFASYAANPYDYNEKGNNHPCPKPVAWMEWLVGRASLEGETILDPFVGSGTTGVACANLGRKFIGIEIEERYFDIACERIAAAYAQGRLFA